MTDYESMLPHVSVSGRPLCTIENLQEICRRVGVVIRYNTALMAPEVVAPGIAYSPEIRDKPARVWLASECAKFGYPVRHLRGFILAIADANHYTPSDYKRYLPSDPLRAALQGRLNWDSPEHQWVWRTVGQILAAVGYEHPTRAEETRAGKLIRKLNGWRGRRGSGGQRLTLAPLPAVELKLVKIDRSPPPS